MSTATAFISPSRLPASAKIALFEDKRRQRTATRHDGSPSFQRPTKSSASRAVFTAISPNSSTKRRSSIMSSPPATATTTSIARVVSPCTTSSSKSSRSHASGNSGTKTKTPAKPSPTAMVTPRKQSPLQSKRLGLLLSPRTSKQSRLSSNQTASPHSTTAPSPATVSRLRRQVDHLRRRVFMLESENTDVNELLDLIQTKEDDCKEKDEQLQKHIVKLKTIEQGLQEIEQEREALSTKANRLESEQQAFQHQLANREQEIVALSARCASQTEKVKESTILRTRNAELARQVAGLQEVVARYENDHSDAASLRQQLEECQQERDSLLQRLQRNEQDFVAVDEKLRACLVNSEKLMEERNAWETERLRLVRRAELDIEQQRQDHVQYTSELYQDLVARDETIRGLEQSMRDKDAAALENQRKFAELERELESSRRAMDAKRLLESKLTQQKNNLEVVVAEQKLALADDQSNRIRFEQSKKECCELRKQLDELRMKLGISLATSEKLSGEKCSWEAERTSFVQHADRLLDLQEQSASRYDEELKMREEKILLLESQALEKDCAIDKLHQLKQIYMTEQETSDKVKHTTDELVREMSNLRDALARKEVLFADGQSQRKQLVDERDDLRAQLSALNERLEVSIAGSVVLGEEFRIRESEQQNLLHKAETYYNEEQNKQLQIIADIRNEQAINNEATSALMQLTRDKELLMRFEHEQARLLGENAELERIRRELTVCQEEREDLLHLLECLKQDSSTREEKFATCYTALEQLAKEKCSWEAERVNLVKKAEHGIEDQKHLRLQSIAVLEEATEVFNTKVCDLETLLQVKDETISCLRKDLEESQSNLSKVLQNKATEKLCFEHELGHLQDAPTRHDKASFGQEAACHDLEDSQRYQVMIKKRLEESDQKLKESLARQTLSVANVDKINQALEQCQSDRDELREQLERREKELEIALAQHANMSITADTMQQQLKQCLFDRDEFAQRLKKMTQELQDTHDRHDLISNNADAARQELELCQSVRDEIFQQLRATEQKLDEDQDRQAISSEESKAVHQELEQCKLELSDLIGRLEGTEHNLNEASTERDNVLKQVALLREELLQCQTERDEHAQKSSSTEQKLKAALIRQASALADADTLSQELAECQSRRNSVHEQLNRKDQDLTDALGRLNNATMDADTIRSDLTQCQAGAKVLRQELNTTKNDLKNALARNANALRDIDDVRQELAQCMLERDELHRRLQCKEEHMRSMEESVQEREKTLMALRQVVNDLELQRSDLQQSLERQWSEQEAKIRRLDIAHMQKLDSRDEVIASLEAEVERSLSQLMIGASLQQQAEEHVTLFNTLTSDIEALRQEKEALKDTLADKGIYVAELEAAILKREIEESFAESRAVAERIGDHDHSQSDSDKRLQQDPVADATIGDFGAEILYGRTTIADLGQQCSEKDFEQLTEKLVSLEKERDALQKECHHLQQSAETMSCDRRGLLNSLEKHVSSVEKLRKLEQTSLEKLAVSQKALKAAQLAVETRDARIKVLECELGKSCQLQEKSFHIMSSKMGPLELVSRECKPHVTENACHGRMPVYPGPAAVSDDERDDSYNQANDSMESEILFNSVSMSVDDSLVDLDLDADLETLLAYDD